MRCVVSRRELVELAVGAAAAGLMGCGQESESVVEVVDEEKADAATDDASAVQDGSEEEAMESSDTDAGTAIEGQILSFDLHADTIDTLCMHDLEPYASADSSENHDGSLAESDASVSVDRMGDVGWAQCYAVWTPDDCPSVSHLEFYRRGASFFAEQMAEHGDVFEHVKMDTDIRSVVAGGKVAAILTVENSCALEEGIQVVEEFERDGVLVCGLTWNGLNAVGGGASTDEGLTELGREYVAQLESRRMVVDVSHLSDQSFWDLDAIAKRPYIATHSNARAVCGVPRNLTDDQFKAIRDRGGIVGLNFHRGFVSGGEYGFDELVAHVEHWLDLGGADCVALGGDRDGSSIPEWLRDCSTQGDLFAQMAERIGEEQARKLFFDNAADFFARNATV